MAHLLGTETCINSLQSDVIDLQATVNDSMSRVGPVRFPSWKFPDKISSDLDMDGFMNEYTFTRDEEGNQISHIILFELVIDRHVLLLQCFTRYLEQILSSSDNKTSHKTVGAAMSIGLVVKKFWNKMVQMATVLGQLQNENKNQSRSISKLEEALDKVTEELVQVRDRNSRSTIVDSCIPPSSSSSSSVLELDPTRGGPSLYGPPSATSYSLLRSPEDKDISMEVRSMACQTFETAFVPCEACLLAQHSLKEVGDLVVGICDSQGLPSTLSRYRAEKRVDDMMFMSASDVSRWSAEQSKDLIRITGHLESLMSEIEPLKEQVQSLEGECSSLSEEVLTLSKRLQNEKQSQILMNRDHRDKVVALELKHRQVVADLDMKYDTLLDERNKLSTKLKHLNLETTQQKQKLLELELTNCQVKATLSEQVDVNESQRGKISDLESAVVNMTVHLAGVQERLNSTKLILTNEESKNESITIQSKELQDKHDSLVERVDVLDHDCVQLRQHVAEIEQLNTELTTSLDTSQQHNTEYQTQITHNEELLVVIQTEKATLETSLVSLKQNITELETKIDEQEQKERFLAAFPDLTKSTGSEVTEPGSVGTGQQGTGSGPVNMTAADITVEMDQQLMANNMRIKILEDYNKSLRNSLQKMIEYAAKKNENFQFTDPIPLFTEQARQGAVSSKSHIPGNISSFRDKPQPRLGELTPPFDVQPRPTDHPLQLKQRGQSDEQPFTTNTTTTTARDIRSGNAMSKMKGSSSSISAYSKLKKAGHIKPGALAKR